MRDDEYESLTTRDMGSITAEAMIENRTFHMLLRLFT